MILADTSVWVEHLHRGGTELARLLSDGRIVCHPFVIGELACGNLRQRGRILSLLRALPSATVAGHDEVLHLLAERCLHGKGLGWIDVHLLASALLTGCKLWTRDKTLGTVARTLRVQA